MSVTAAITEAWQLVQNDVNLRTIKRREVDIEARLIRGWLDQSDTSVIEIKCHFIGLTAFTEQTGEEQSFFSYYVGGGVTLSFGSTARKYLCTRDSLRIDDYVCGEGWEFQTWECVSKFETVEGSYYEEEMPEEGDAFDPLPEPEPEE
jgi:hypothetical protein